MRKYLSFFILYFLHSSISANDESFINAQEIMKLIRGGGYIKPYPEECTTILKLLAHSASDFTLCSITNAKPITLCKNCITDYLAFSNTYHNLTTTIINGTSCGSLFISQDRFDVVLEFHDRITDIWNKGHCDDCFDFSEGAAKPSNNTMKFNKMFEDTINCINSNLDPTSNNTDEVCVQCMQSYLALDMFYKTLSKDSIGVDTVCMDTVDSMNTTRSIWSKTLNCCKLRKTPEVIFLCCTAIISLLPLLYYVAVRYCGPIRDLPNVLKESRFKQSIMRSVQSYRRIN
ncbi:osteopetrosis-associated transmembrane protein 1 [Ostrinia nubilalis]|uniref:osteopetrosis-associated transmembrane protein 1 n=1 Tax=Ostrinia furnacalis TaxID=93504 RepID=UPI00103C76D0|nr:osteopetrosis-associated transmembrane protein 1 [Ostrinia furnacalis]